MKISVIIPTYNESLVIEKCLKSLSLQSRSFELIIVDDGSTDATYETIQHSEYVKDALLLKSKHQGPGAARNIGARKATGSILVFVDSDMEFDKNYIQDLVSPIEKGASSGTFTKNEYVSNWNNFLARAWNYNQNIFDNRRIPQDYPNTSPVFRAILRSEFMRVGGFTEGVGWTDDWTLSEKLHYQATITSAICYHANPETLNEVFYQARWIGKNKFLTQNIFRRILNLFRYSLVSALVVGLYKSFYYKFPPFLFFKIIYNYAISVSLLESFLSVSKNK